MISGIIKAYEKAIYNISLGNTDSHNDIVKDLEHKLLILRGLQQAAASNRTVK